MEMTDGIDFEEWNATVRSLSAAVDRLDRTAAKLADLPWMPRLTEALEEVSGELRRLSEGGPPPAWVADPNPTPTRPPAASAAEEPARATTIVVSAVGPDPQNMDLRVPVRFGDPDAIATYGRRKRRP